MNNFEWFASFITPAVKKTTNFSKILQQSFSWLAFLCAMAFLKLEILEGTVGKQLIKATISSCRYYYSTIWNEKAVNSRTACIGLINNLKAFIFNDILA